MGHFGYGGAGSLQRTTLLIYSQFYRQILGENTQKIVIPGHFISIDTAEMKAEP